MRKEQDFGYTSREGWDGCVDEGDAVSVASIEGWGL